MDIYLEDNIGNIMEDIKGITEKINDEKSNETPNKDKLTKLYFEQLLKGMQIPYGTLNP